MTKDTLYEVATIAIITLIISGLIIAIISGI